MNLDDVTSTPLPKLPPRRADSHKGDYGRALLVGGSRGMSGAIALAGMAALRGGAGLVTLAVPRSVQGVVASLEPSYMTHALAENNGRIAARAADDIIRLSQNATAIALGPGIGRSIGLTHFAARIYADVEAPVVVDADALFALSERDEALKKPCGPRILTPHPGEFARLTRKQSPEAQRFNAAARLAWRDLSGRTIVVLKGHGTVVTDGERFSINQSGNPGMATGGAGDVLTGVITALVCQGLEPFDAARLAVHLHGLAGDLAAEILGQVSLTASDLVDYLPQAFQSLEVSS